MMPARSGCRGVTRSATAALVALVVLVGSSGAAIAETEVQGAADFRTAPVVGDGEYTDTIDVGGQRWYGVMATVGVPFTVTGGLVDAAGREDLTFTMRLRGDSLEEMQADPEELSFIYSHHSTGDQTAVVFLEVDLVGTEKQGEELQFRLDIVGTRTPSTEECGSCPAATDAAEAEAELADLQSDTAAEDAVSVREEAASLVASNKRLARERREAEGPSGWIAVGLAGSGAVLLLAAIALRRARRRSAEV